MEEVTLNLARMGDGRPLLVTQPLGSAPAVYSVDKIDRLWIGSQRHNAVLTGDFSCCRMNHIVTSADGKDTPIPCDKEQLKSVLADLHAQQVAELRSLLPAEGFEAQEFEHRIRSSLGSPTNAFWNHFNFVILRPMALATELAEPEWSPRFEEIGPAEHTAWLAQLETDERASPSLCAWLCAVAGNLPMLRYSVEVLGADPCFLNLFGMSCVIMASRFGHLSCLKYLCARVPPSHISYVSAGLGLSAIGDVSTITSVSFLELRRVYAA